MKDGEVEMLAPIIRRKIAKLWLGIGLVYALLLFWHHPFKAPLTAADVSEILEIPADALVGEGDGQAARMLAFLLEDDGHPFFMINLNLRSDDPAAADAARTYGTYMLPRLLARASYPVLSNGVIAELNNTLGVGDFDELVVVRYRSRRDFLEVIGTQEFRDALQYKSASLNGWVAAPSTGFTASSIPVLAFALLCAIGAFGTVRIALRHQRLGS